MKNFKSGSNQAAIVIFHCDLAILLFSFKKLREKKKKRFLKLYNRTIKKLKYFLPCNIFYLVSIYRKSGIRYIGELFWFYKKTLYLSFHYIMLITLLCLIYVFNRQRTLAIFQIENRIAYYFVLQKCGSNLNLKYVGVRFVILSFLMDLRTEIARVPYWA